MNTFALAVMIIIVGCVFVAVYFKSCNEELIKKNELLRNENRTLKELISGKLKKAEK